MKSTFLKLFSLFLMGSFVLTSCGDDEPDPVTGTAPTITLTAGEGNIGKSWLPNKEFTVSFRVERGSSDMNSFQVNENGSPISEDSGRIKFNDTIPTANPTLLFGSQEDEFTVAVTIQTNATAGTYDIDVIVTDSNSPTPRSETYSFEYTVVQPDLEEIQGVLLNAGGPAGTGGLNLQTGEGTGSSGPSASSSHIRDLGLDQSLPNNENWIQKIAPITSNGVTLRHLSSEADYDNIQLADQLPDLYQGGTEVGPSGTTNKNVVGDTFIAKQGDNYYIFIIREVTVTADNNQDNYLLDIKRR